MYTMAQWYFNFLQKHAMKSYVVTKIIIWIIRYDLKVMGRLIDRNLSQKNR